MFKIFFAAVLLAVLSLPRVPLARQGQAARQLGHQDIRLRTSLDRGEPGFLCSAGAGR